MGSLFEETKPVQQNEQNQPYPLPPGWVWTTLGEICYPPQYGWTTKAVSQGDVKLLRTSDITSGEIDWSKVPYCAEKPHDIDKYLLKEGDIVISRAGSVGYGILINNPPPRSVFASYLIRFRPRYPAIEGRYLHYFLHSPFYWHQISEQKLGIAIPNVNATKLRCVKVPLSPLPEQRRIVAKIEELFSQLDAAEEGLQRIQRNLKRYRAAVLKAAVEGRLVPTEAELARREGRTYETGEQLLRRILAERRCKWEEQEWVKLVEKAKKKAAQARRKARGLPARMKDIPPEEWQSIPEAEYRRYLPKDDRWKQKYKDPIPPDTTNLPPLPEGWVWATVEMVGETVTGTTPTKSEPENYGDYLPFVKPPELRDAPVSKAEDGISQRGASKARVVPKQTILVSCIGILGKTAITTRALAINQQINAIIPCVVDPYYLFYLAQSSYFRQSLEKIASATTIPIVNRSKFNRIPIPLPPLAEQRRIVAEVERRLSVAREAEKAVETNLKRIARLRQAILKRAFEGKLVPQNPNDEPAEKLLEKIRGEDKERGPRRKTTRRRRRSQKMRSIEKREPLYEVLKRHKRPMSPEELFRQSGFDETTVEEFYEELRSEVYIKKRIRERRDGEKVQLEVIKNED